ncbi:MAG: hypothetical protein CMH52_11390 [Myxococcales bacterium]|nr:hypothetical protein [Myxococcales bacterium]
MRFIFFTIVAMTLICTGCADRKAVPTGARSVQHVDQSKTETLDWPPNDWPERIEGENTKPYMPIAPGSEYDFGDACYRPDNCDSDSADWPDCVNTECNTGDCSYPVFTTQYGFCTRSCIDDTQCENAVPNGPYGTEFKCLTDGVSGTCAPGSNDRCDYSRNGQCDDPEEACKYQLIFAPDTFYGAVCQPRTPDGREIGESCDEDAGVFCANDMCLYDVCTSFCDPDASESACPTGYRCFEEWYPFGTDSSYNVDICMPQYCETDTDCPDDFACVLGFEFNKNNILRGICLPKEDGSVTAGGECCVTDECTAQFPEVACQGATCFDDETGNGYCSGMCNSDADCPDEGYCTILNFGISAEPGSAPAQICRKGSGSGRPCETNSDCAADGDIPDEACDYVIRGEIEAGRTISEITVAGRCTTIPINAVGYGEDCGGLVGECTNASLCLNAGGSGFCGEPCRNTRDCADGSLCFGIGLTDNIEGGSCVESRLIGMPDSSLTTCRRDSECDEGEHCGINIIGSDPPVVETMCMTNEGAGSAGSECSSNMDCRSETCLPLSTDSSVPGYCLATCRSAEDCGGEGFSCSRQVMDAVSGAEAKVCRPTTACTPCAFDRTAVCGGGLLCSEVQYGSAGTGNACLQPCDGAGDAACENGFECTAQIEEGGNVSNTNFVCTPRNPQNSCAAAQPR